MFTRGMRKIMNEANAIFIVKLYTDIVKAVLKPVIVEVLRCQLAEESFDINDVISKHLDIYQQ